MAVDAFMVLKDAKNKTIAGETQDAIFSKVQAIEIFDFDFEASKSADEKEEADGGQPREMADDDPDAFFASLAGMADLYQQRETAHDSFSFSIKKMLDVSSPFLFRHYCETQKKKKDELKTSFAECTIYLCIAGVTRDSSKTPDDVARLVLHFEDLYITKYALKLDTALNIPDEDIDFFFHKYKMGYRPQSATGSFSTKLRFLGFDFVEDTKL